MRREELLEIARKKYRSLIENIKAGKCTEENIKNEAIDIFVLRGGMKNPDREYIDNWLYPYYSPLISAMNYKDTRAIEAAELTLANVLLR